MPSSLQIFKQLSYEFAIIVNQWIVLRDLQFWNFAFTKQDWNWTKNGTNSMGKVFLAQSNDYLQSRKSVMVISIHWPIRGQSTIKKNALVTHQYHRGIARLLYYCAGQFSKMLLRSNITWYMEQFALATIWDPVWINWQSRGPNHSLSSWIQAPVHICTPQTFSNMNQLNGLCTMCS